MTASSSPSASPRHTPSRAIAATALALVALACSSTDGVSEAELEGSVARQVEALHDSSCPAGETHCAKSRLVRVLDSYMHYREAGNRQGTPIILMHGQPTWSYLYRNIIPQLPADAHIVAPDAIGYGFSGKPDIAYSWQDHVDYMEAFIEALDLRDVILVVHDMGSFQGLAYAERHPENVRGIVMMESIVAPPESIEQFRNQFPDGTIGAEFADFLLEIRSDPAAAERRVVDENYFIEELLPATIARDLSERELDAYRLPFRSRESRLKLMTIPLGIPSEGQPEHNLAMVSRFAQYLTTSAVPKLVLYSDPGLLFNGAIAQMLTTAFPNSRAESLGEGGLHFLQEDFPNEIAAAISEFYVELE